MDIQRILPNTAPALTSAAVEGRPAVSPDAPPPAESVTITGAPAAAPAPPAPQVEPHIPAAKPAHVPLQSLGGGVVGGSTQILYQNDHGLIMAEDPAIAAYGQLASTPARELFTAPLLAPVKGTEVHPQRPLMESATTSALSTAAVTTLTPSGASALGLCMKHFTPAEFLELNAGMYHSPAHPLNVTGLVGDVARKLGRSESDATFLQQVALIHDADERINLKTGERMTGGPARVQVTLEWMDQNKDALKDRMSWDDGQFVKAKALIARTDFPFDEAPRAYGTRYDGKSPQQLYKDLLNQIPPQERARVMEDGVILSYSDQLGNYTGSPEQSVQTVLGLAHEIKSVPADVLLKGSGGFLFTAARNTALDNQIAAELGVQGANIPTRAQLDAAMPAGDRARLQETLQMFDGFSKQ